MEKKLLAIRKLPCHHSKSSLVSQKSQIEEREKVKLLLHSDRERQKVSMSENTSMISHLYRSSPNKLLKTGRQSIQAALSSFLSFKERALRQHFDSIDSKISSYKQVYSLGSNELLRLVTTECLDKAKYLTEILALAEDINDLQMKKLNKEIDFLRERSTQNIAALACSHSKELAKVQLRMNKIKTERDEAKESLSQQKRVFEKKSRNYKHRLTRPNPSPMNESSQMIHTIGFNLLAKLRNLSEENDDDLDLLTQTINNKYQQLQKIKEDIKHNKVVLKEIEGNVTEANKELKLLGLEIEVKKLEYKSFKQRK